MVGVFDQVETVAVFQFFPSGTVERIARWTETDLPIIDFGHWSQTNRASIQSILPTPVGARYRYQPWNGRLMLLMSFTLLATVNADETSVTLPQRLVELAQRLVPSWPFLLNAKKERRKTQPLQDGVGAIPNILLLLLKASPKSTTCDQLCRFTDWST